MRETNNALQLFAFFFSRVNDTGGSYQDLQVETGLHELPLVALKTSQCLHLRVTYEQSFKFVQFVSYTETRAHQDLMVYLLYPF